MEAGRLCDFNTIEKFQASQGYIKDSLKKKKKQRERLDALDSSAPGTH